MIKSGGGAIIGYSGSQQASRHQPTKPYGDQTENIDDSKNDIHRIRFKTEAQGEVRMAKVACSVLSLIPP